MNRKTTQKKCDFSILKSFILDDVVCTKLQIDMLDCTAFTVRFLAFLRMLTLILSNNTIQIHYLSHNYHAETLSSQDLQKCSHNAGVQVCSISLMYKLALKYSFSVFDVSIFLRFGSNVIMFSCFTVHSATGARCQQNARICSWKASTSDVIL